MGSKHFNCRFCWSSSVKIHQLWTQSWSPNPDTSNTCTSLCLTRLKTCISQCGDNASCQVDCTYAESMCINGKFQKLKNRKLAFANYEISFLKLNQKTAHVCRTVLVVAMAAPTRSASVKIPNMKKIIWYARSTLRRSLSFAQKTVIIGPAMYSTYKTEIWTVQNWYLN